MPRAETNSMMASFGMAVPMASKLSVHLRAMRLGTGGEKLFAGTGYGLFNDGDESASLISVFLCAIGSMKLSGIATIRLACLFRELRKGLPPGVFGHLPLGLDLLKIGVSWSWSRM